MANDKTVKDNKKEKDQPITKPDPETLHKTDPQENMKGPVSSLMNETRKKIEHNDADEGKEEEEEK